MVSGPTLEEVLDSAVPFALPLHRPFRGLVLREGVLIEGPSGWGEFAPFADYSARAAARWLSCALEASYGAWAAPVRSQVPVNAILPAVDAGVAALLTRQAVDDLGCRTMKVKAGSTDLADDDDRVAAVREVLDATLGRGVGRIRIDANAAWSLPQAVEALQVLSRHELEYVEQPCSALDDLRALHRVSPVRLAVDETIRTADEPATSIRDVADLAVLKPAPLGGVAATLQLAQQLDVPVVISGSLDSSIGLAPAIAAAAALAELPFDCGLGTGALLAADLCDPQVPREGGLAAVPSPRRIPDAEMLERAHGAVSPAWARTWRQRLADAWEALERERVVE